MSDQARPPSKPVKAPKTRNRLEQLVSLHANATGQAQNRLRNWVSFMVFAGAIERALLADGTPAFWFKGGLTMEARFPGPARTTRDVDAMFRVSAPATDEDGVPKLDDDGDPVTGVDDAALLAALDKALAEEYHGFTFEVEEPQRVKETVYRVARIRLFFVGRNWGSVKLEISPPEGSASEPESVPALPLDSVGLRGPETLPCLPVRYQIAQKIHAVTERFPHRENDRERDLIDLILLRELVDDLRVVRDACVEIFTSRKKHTWPPRTVTEPGWRERYPETARQIGFAIEDAEDATAAVRAFIDEIDAAGV